MRIYILAIEAPNVAASATFYITYRIQHGRGRFGRTAVRQVQLYDVFAFVPGTPCEGGALLHELLHCEGGMLPKHLTGYEGSDDLFKPKTGLGRN